VREDVRVLSRLFRGRGGRGEDLGWIGQARGTVEAYPQRIRVTPFYSPFKGVAGKEDAVPEKKKTLPSNLAWKGLGECQPWLIPPVATAATTAAAPVFSWTSFVDGERSSVRFFAVQGVNGRLGFITIAHLDKAKAFRATRISVHDDLSGLNGAMRREHVFQIGVGHTIRQVSDIQLHSHVGPPLEKITQHN
jgi:hypothetical protein